jgi:hypothetical protein
LVLSRYFVHTFIIVFITWQGQSVSVPVSPTRLWAQAPQEQGLHHFYFSSLER